MGGACCKSSDVPPERLLASMHLQYNLMRRHDKDILDDYEILEEIGEGSISKISKVRRKKPSYFSRSTAHGSGKFDSRRRRSTVRKQSHTPSADGTSLNKSSKGNKPDTILEDDKPLPGADDIPFELMKARRKHSRSVHSTEPQDDALPEDDIPEDMLRRRRGPEASTSRSLRVSIHEAFRKVFSSGHSDEPEDFYALKEIDLKLFNQDNLRELENEINLLKRLDHPHIIKAYETYKVEGKRMAIIMELCSGGDLYSRQPYSEREAAMIVAQILSAVAYLHDRHIIHRDLKYQNILFASPRSYDIKVIDLGLAKRYLNENERQYARVGTLYTMSPQVLAGSYFGASSDLWSIGVIAYMLLSSEKPFWGNSVHEIKQRINKAEVKFESKVWKQISKDAKDFVLSLLKKDPNDRLTARQALQHPFIKNRMSHSNAKPDPKLMNSLQSNLVRYADSSDFKKIVLNVIANRSSTDELFELRKAFAEYDKDGSGVIDLSEFKKALAHCNYTDKEIESIFNRIGLNKTGKIMYTEFVAATLESQGEIEHHKLALAFDELDVEKTGYLSKENLRAVLPKTMKDEEIDKLMAEVIVSEDGRVSFEDFKKAFRSDRQKKIDEVYDSKPTKKHGLGA